MAGYRATRPYSAKVAPGRRRLTALRPRAYSAQRDSAANSGPVATVAIRIYIASRSICIQNSDKSRVRESLVAPTQRVHPLRPLALVGICTDWLGGIKCIQRSAG